MQLNFCTLFNSAYLSRGLAMYKSLLRYCDDFHLWIFAFDEDTYRFFSKQEYKNITVVSLKEFEDNELLRIKSSRTAGEYCWTCTSSTILYCIEKFQIDHCTYVDADIYFYENPKVLIDEMNGNSVLITEHRYSPQYDQSATSGIYCVQFITFKNDRPGLNALRWWRNACIDWCYARVEDGKFGDQKYLDDWTSRFEDVHVLRNPGGGIAPWNVQQYRFEILLNKIHGEEIVSGKKFNAVFYHFHGLKFHPGNYVQLTGSYEINDNIIDLFYKKYVLELTEAKREILKTTGSMPDPHGTAKEALPSEFMVSAKNKIHNAKQLGKSLLRGKMSYPKRFTHFYNIDFFTKQAT
jgi:hypothetical protein